MTGLCNNNCLFCLDGERKDRFHKGVDGLKKEILEAREDRCTRLVLSGGEPTIFPQVIDIVRYAKGIGFSKIQTISNGRMYAIKSFTEDMIRSGLTEVTFSIHGPDAEIHDHLTRVRGSFKETIRGLRNVSAHPGMIFNTDTVVTSENYRRLLDTVRFLHESYWVNEMNLMNIVPQGNALRYGMLYSYGDVMPYVKEVIDYCEEKGIVLWLSRFPERYLDGYEKYIQDAHKMVDDVRGAAEVFKGDSPPCDRVKCGYCGISSICDKIFRVKEEYRKSGVGKADDVVVADKGDMMLQDGDIVKYPSPERRLEDCRIPRFSELIPRLMMAAEGKRVVFRDFPYCVVKGGFMVENAFRPLVKKGYLKDCSLDILKVAEGLCLEVKTNPLVCDPCMLRGRCDGIYKKYMRLYGTKELKPFLHREIRITLKCNESCRFCNTDRGSENVITEPEKIRETIKAWEGLEMLTISGGEPLLDPNLPEYIRIARESGASQVDLQTNATMVTMARARALKDAGLTKAFVSLHSLDDQANRKMGKGLVKKVLEGISNFHRVGISLRINIVLNSFNYKELPRIADHIALNHPWIEAVIISFVAPLSRARENPGIIPRITDVLPDLREGIGILANNGIRVRIPSRCGFPPCFLPGFERYFDELSERGRWNDLDGKRKAKGCGKCRNYHSCTGLWEKYLDIYGYSEFEKASEGYTS